MIKFEQLNIIEPILNALYDENYETPTAIQAKAIPILLQGKDVLGSAQTGTGKTAAFAIPILQHLHIASQNESAKSKNIKALIITPTRELAIQIGESFTVYGKNTKLKNSVIFGGVGQGPQTESLKKGIDILIATPGRLLDLIDQGYIKLNSLSHFVLDEADQMLDMGFIHDIKKIIKLLPVKRQSLFFSATMPKNIVELSKTILHAPEKIEVSAVSSTAETIKQYLYYTNKATKQDLLLHILKNKNIEQVLLFCRTKHGADKLVKRLKANQIQAAAIHGDKAQTQRQKVLSQFKDGVLRVLVATDIAARGIDIDKLKYVINYEIPNVAETYVHRIGRSGRAGDDGTAISFSEPEENELIKDIEKLIQQKISVVDDNPFPQTDRAMTEKEKKEFEKEKQRKKQEFFAARKNSMLKKTTKFASA